ncbi:uncharacterized protein G2W53_001062 [Senna tora]|uniref:Uncharacterized protein n=1 Tax=Senna tora TaxID=362788 RepID=A0A835CM83_9FABA|nr:uncharacterized protein G2W53_001062 [Senna tora]
MGVKWPNFVYIKQLRKHQFTNSELNGSLLASSLLR